MTDPSEAAARRPDRDARWALLIGVLLVAPLLIAAVVVATRAGGYRAGFDNALIELRVRDTFDHLVTTGPYSRFGWYHPGPLLFYVYALPYRLSGRSPVSIPVTALVVNAAVVALMTWLGWRIGRLAGVLWIALPAALLMRTMGIGLLRSQWNPDVVVLMFFAFVLAAWAVAVGHRRMVLLAVALGCFVVQAHVGDALPVLLFLVLAVAFGETRRPRAQGRAWPVYVGALGIIVVLWLVPVYGDLVAGNHNLRHVASFAVTGGSATGEERVGFLAALRVVGAQTGPRPLWMWRSVTDLPFGGALSFNERWWWIPIGGVVLAAATLWGWVRRQRLVATLGTLTVVGLVAAVYATGSIRGQTWSYLSWWVWVLGALSGVVALCALWFVVPERSRRGLRTVLLGVTLAVTALVAAGIVRDTADEPTPTDTTGLTLAQQQDLVRTVGDRAVRALRGSDGVVLDTTYGILESPGLALALERAGIPVRVVGHDASIPYGPDRQWRCGRGTRLAVFSSAALVQREHPRGDVIARWSVPWKPEELEQKRLSRYAWLQAPESERRLRMLEALDAELAGPKYLVEVFDQGPVRKACAS